MLCGGMGIAGGAVRAQAMVEQRMQELARDLAEARRLEAEKDSAVKRVRRSVRNTRRKLEVQSHRDRHASASTLVTPGANTHSALSTRTQVITSPQLLVAQARALNMLVPVHAKDVEELYCTREQLPPEEPPASN